MKDRRKMDEEIDAEIQSSKERLSKHMQISIDYITSLQKLIATMEARIDTREKMIQDKFFAATDIAKGTVRFKENLEQTKMELNKAEEALAEERKNFEDPRGYLRKKAEKVVKTDIEYFQKILDNIKDKDTLNKIDYDQMITRVFGEKSTDISDKYHPLYKFINTFSESFERKKPTETENRDMTTQFRASIQCAKDICACTEGETKRAEIIRSFEKESDRRIPDNSPLVKLKVAGLVFMGAVLGTILSPLIAPFWGAYMGASFSDSDSTLKTAGCMFLGLAVGIAGAPFIGAALIGDAVHSKVAPQTPHSRAQLFAHRKAGTELAEKMNLHKANEDKYKREPGKT